MDDKPVGEDIDILQRQPFIDNVLTVVNNCKDQQQGLSFSIDGGWGYGKSFILDRVQDQLANDWIVLRYDSWKYDYYEEPLVALISSISDQLQDHHSGIDPTLIKSVAETAADMALDCAIMAAGPYSVLLKLASKVAGKTYKKIQTARKTGRSYDKYSSLKKNLRIIQKLLTKIGKGKPIVLMIDELDRCLPAYQVKVLERIHHVVNGSNCVVVYALNPAQLSATIRQIYGGNEDRVTAYLKKFLDFSLTLDTGTVSDNIKQKYELEIASFGGILGDSTSNEENIDWFQQVYTLLLSDLEIRVLEKLWQKRRLIHDLIFSKEDKPLSQIYLTCELMLLAMDEWKKRAYLPPNLSFITWQAKSRPELYLHDGFRGDKEIAIKLPETVQSFWTKVDQKVSSSNDVFSDEQYNPITYWIKAPIPESVIFLAAAWTYVNNTSYVKFERENESEIKATDDMFIHLKQSMKNFNNFVKIMS